MRALELLQRARQRAARRRARHGTVAAPEADRLERVREAPVQRDVARERRAAAVARDRARVCGGHLGVQPLVERVQLAQRLRLSR